jgi:hypothetical protein
MGKAAKPKTAKADADRVTCEPQKFEQTVRNLLSMPHTPHRSEKSKGAAPKGDPRSSERKGSGK